MTVAELRELAGRAEAEAIVQAGGAMDQFDLRAANECCDIANRLFLMARNLRERAHELEKGDILGAFDR